MDDVLIDSPLFAIYKDGPHIGAHFLDHLRLRNSEAFAGFHVVRNTITEKTFGIGVAKPFRYWITPEGIFWSSLNVRVTEVAKLDASYEDVRNGHPNRHIVRPRMMLHATFAPDESEQEQRALTAFNFGCMTRCSSCLSLSEILPGAIEEFDAEHPESSKQ